MPTPNPTPAICPLGTYHANDAVCAACPFGKYNNQNDVRSCTPCLPGYVTPAEGSTACTICPQGFYNDKAGSTTPSDLSTCTQCAQGRTTPGLGSNLESQCLSPVANFAWGFVALGVSGVLALIYVVHGRFQQVAFIRCERVVKVQAQAYKRAFAQFEEYFKEIRGAVKHSKAREVVESVRENRTSPSTALTRLYFVALELVKTILFIAVAVILVAIVAVLYILSQFISVLFKVECPVLLCVCVPLLHSRPKRINNSLIAPLQSLIIWKQMHSLQLFHFDMLDYRKVLATIVAEIGIILFRIGLPDVVKVAIAALFTPVFLLFDVLANIRIDFSALNVTCAGAQVGALQLWRYTWL